ncbi:conserved hypothetical protein [Candidatus Defluviicoccus seviourii]|uniref:DNA-directed DNA polymerase family A palm domain-containing protein n=1 Tax=Candidatus Defluviicoccus seviourii TaxID=2565273 RepID=A0A564WH54_9PROT|nr:conserved hypothetical protein [Candidatus Defluviicoccus seviourii]
MTNRVYFDTEYRDDEVILLCALVKPSGNKHEFDLRNNKDLDLLQDFITQHTLSHWVAFAASADLTALLRLGIDITPFNVIDLMAEGRMITLSHDKFFAPRGSLVATLRAFGLELVNEAEKEVMREVILNHKTYTDDQWDAITRYCWEDVECLPPLFNAIKRFHNDIVKGAVELDHMLYRGEYIKAVSITDHRSKGFPVWGEWFDQVMNNRERITEAIIRKYNTQFPIWQYNPRDNKYHLKRDQIELWAKLQGFLKDWERTECGALRLSDDYLEVLGRKHILVENLRKIFKQLNHLKIDLRGAAVNGYVPYRTTAFSAKTGRNGLKPKNGFVLNLPPWMRTVVRPHPGRVLIGADWSSQEVAISAYLSGDENLTAAYETGDPYLALGKMSGRIPHDGTKQTHPLERQLFKGLQLGLNYGMGERALAQSMLNTFLEGGYEVDIDYASNVARRLLVWHRNKFKTYWAWAERKARLARVKGYIQAGDGWTEYVTRRTPQTVLLNFPAQSNAAVMMRQATIKLAKTGIDLLCSQHDAFYVNAPITDEDMVKKTLKSCMDEASWEVIGGVTRVDFKTFHHDKCFWDERGRDLFLLARQELGLGHELWF